MNTITKAMRFKVGGLDTDQFDEFSVALIGVVANFLNQVDADFQIE